MLISLGQANEIVTTASNHKHGTWEIVINIYGKGTATIGDKNYEFSEGTIMCIPPNLPHNKISDNGFRDYYMHVDKIRGISYENIPDEPIIFQDDSEKTFENIMYIMLHLLYSDNANKTTMLNSLCHVCEGLINDWMSNAKIDPAVNRIQNLLISGYADPELDLNVILSSTGYSAEYLRKKFKQETGISPLEYLTNLRITYAKNLLSQKKRLNMSVKEISLLCGFYDSHYFSTIFRKVTGLTPKDFALQAALDDDNKFVQSFEDSFSSDE